MWNGNGVAINNNQKFCVECFVRRASERARSLFRSPFRPTHTLSLSVSHSMDVSMCSCLEFNLKMNWNHVWRFCVPKGMSRFGIALFFVCLLCTWGTLCETEWIYDRLSVINVLFENLAFVFFPGRCCRLYVFIGVRRNTICFIPILPNNFNFPWIRRRRRRCCCRRCFRSAQSNLVHCFVIR